MSVYLKKTIAYEIIQHALGIKTKVMQDWIPENAQPKVILNSRIYHWASRLRKKLVN